MTKITRDEAQKLFENGTVVSHETETGWINYEAVRGCGEDDTNIAWESSMHPSFDGCNAQGATWEFPLDAGLPEGEYYFA
jgi:hypothetical protein